MLLVDEHDVDGVLESIFESFQECGSLVMEFLVDQEERIGG